MDSLKVTKLNDKDAAGNAQAFPMWAERPYLDDIDHPQWEYCSIELGVVSEDAYGCVRLGGIMPAILAQRLANVPLLEAEVETQAARIGLLEQELLEVRTQYSIQQEAADNSHGVAINHQRTAMEALRHAAEMRERLDSLEKEHEEMSDNVEVLSEMGEFHNEQLHGIVTKCSRLLMALKHQRKSDRVSMLCDEMYDSLENCGKVMKSLHKKHQEQISKVLNEGEKGSPATP